jgi:hypothetical protein
MTPDIALIILAVAMIFVGCRTGQLIKAAYQEKKEIQALQAEIKAARQAIENALGPYKA